MYTLNWFAQVFKSVYVVLQQKVSIIIDISTKRDWKLFYVGTKLHALE